MGSACPLAERGSSMAPAEPPDALAKAPGPGDRHHGSLDGLGPTVVFRHHPRHLDFPGYRHVITTRADSRRALGLGADAAVNLVAGARFLADRDGWDLPIWAGDNGHTTGGKLYRVQAVKQFWEEYRAMAPEHRVWYEYVRSDRPVRLYFDLEFDCHDDEHRAKSMDDAVRVINDRVTAMLRRCWTPEVLEPIRYVELNSDRPTKRSRHLIYHLGPDGTTAFASHEHAGEFIRACFPALKNLKSRDAHNEDARLLWRRGPGGAGKPSELMHVIDPNIYKGDRCFRLWLSHKHGSTSGGLCEQPADSWPRSLERFQDTLVSVHPRGLAQLLRLFPDDEVTGWLGRVPGERPLRVDQVDRRTLLYPVLADYLLDGAPAPACGS